MKTFHLMSLRARRAKQSHSCNCVNWIASSAKLLGGLAMTFILISCGGGDGNFTNPTSDHTGKTGSIKATVTNSKSFNPNISHGQIKQYKVTITAPDITEPIVATFDGTTTSGRVDGVPVGEDRAVSVEALNPNDATIRSGEATGLEIEPDGVTEAEVKMESVPIFANLTSGNKIPNTRFIAKVFSDPADPVRVEDEFSGSVSVLMDASRPAVEIMPDASTGIANITPPLMPAGEHKFTIKNVRTGRSTTVTVHLTDGSKAKAAPIFSAASNQPATFGVSVLAK